MGECEWGSEYEQGRQEVGVWRSVGGVSKECEQETEQHEGRHVKVGGVRVGERIGRV